MKNTTQKCKLLWADDDQDDLMMMREVIQDMAMGCDIIEVENGLEVMRYLNRARQDNDFPCLLVLDMNMPIMSGRETLAAIKADAVLSTVPIVVFTTSNSELDRLFCRRFGVDMITKPITYSGMQDIVRHLFDLCKKAG